MNDPYGKQLEQEYENFLAKKVRRAFRNPDLRNWRKRYVPTLCFLYLACRL